MLDLGGGVTNLPSLLLTPLSALTNSSISLIITGLAGICIRPNGKAAVLALSSGRSWGYIYTMAF